MHSVVSRLLILFLCAFVALPAWSQGMPFGDRKIKKPESLLIIHAGRLLAVPGEAPLAEQSIVVRNDRIEAVVDGYIGTDDVEPGRATPEIVDLSDKFVLPGLMDSHVHLNRATGAYQENAIANAAPDKGPATVNTMVNIRLTLNAGFTAVRDLGSDNESVYAVRDAIDKGAMLGPTILASGPSIGVTSSHGSSRPGAAVCDGVDGCRRLTRQLEKAGADLIKIKVSGGFSTNTGFGQHMTRDEMVAIVKAAHMRGIIVTAHAYAPESVIDAVNAGVDCIEHGHLADEAGLKLMREKGVFLVPTVTVAEPPSFVQGFLGGRKAISVTIRDEYQSFENAYKMGVKVAFGTDAGVYPHGKNADEFMTMVKLGMTPADAIRAATVVAAELFALEGLTGTIESGSRADIIAVNSDPLSDIGALKDVDFVLKSGQVAKRNGAMQVPLDYGLEHSY
ncbi:MAG: amidohydrolase family protein [Gammaproteobacteria bacterium]|jgi:imidazolonepropionase-like amidohydrolase|nr:amidohydrolase family protein [Gammaproteobacteria bacterium]MDP6616148.1 amidohydrolase family protein [Gammaproteobacteria bacterium]MDP6694834.1 amidohydrolase family protein [Gammaproteobacteria bacterium]MDP7041274.1 amidohydrolase family protein [Gammaproteobacteria bacterium]